MQAQEILDFWFLPAGSPGHGVSRTEWFRKDERFDGEIRERFGTTIEQAIAGGLRDWDASAEGTLARILVLDQFTRNAYRGMPEAFAGDQLALAAARALADSGGDKNLTVLQRWFAYLPFEHSEDAAMQERSVALFTTLSELAPGFDSALDYAHRHRGVIARFGRFPHRNPILGRASTPDEVDYLNQPGSGF